MDESKITEVLQASQQREAEAWAVFESRFDKQFPMPDQPNVRLMAAIGWQFIATSIQAVASVVLASLRTAQMFFDAAAGSNIVFQYIEAAAAIAAIELGIVIFSTIKSEMKNAATRIEDLNRALDVSVKLLNTGIGAGVFVSIIAGLGVSFEGFGLDVTGFKWVLAITMAIGASVIAWVSGDILGAMLARFSNARLQAGHEYAQAIIDRNEQKNDMWSKAPERKIAVSELTELKALLEAQRRDNIPQSVKQAPQPRQKISTRSSEIRVKIYNYLDTDWDAHHDITLIPGPTKLVEDLGVAKGYASETIKAWKVERSIPTPESSDASQ
jgi:hypothetical protein